MLDFIPWRTFSVFISSTFADMQAERDYLKNFVLPKVRDELQKKRIKLEIVDLRWGLDTTSIEQEDERELTVLKVCLDEIKRCNPFFICFLGDRYGWVPTELRMKDATVGMKQILPRKGKSVTELEIEFGVLASEEQLNRSVFYFRDSIDHRLFPPEKVGMFSDEHNPELSVEERLDRCRALEKLKSTIISHFEIHDKLDKVKTYTASWDSQIQKVVGLEQWGDIVYEDILRECFGHAKDTLGGTPQNWQDQERVLLEAFIEGHISNFCGRELLLEDLKRHLLFKDQKSWGLVLTGESGSGKSALFAMMSKIMHQENCLVLSHSAGLSSRAKNVLDLLQIWNKQLMDFLGMAYNLGPQSKTLDGTDLGMKSSGQETNKSEIEKIQEEFKRLLHMASRQKQVVLLIDALDRFEDTDRAGYMTWLPTIMPANVRMLCTTITGTEQRAVKYHSGLFVRSIDLFTLAEAKTALNMQCKRQHKNIPARVETTILKKKRDDGLLAISSPLWLSLAINILMAMDNDDFERMKQLEGRDDEVIVDYMETLVMNFPSLPGELFISLLEKAASIFEEDFTWKVFNFIATSRNGLREGDLQELIPNTKDENWNALLFANLRRWFGAHLREEGEGLQWNLAHSILRNSLLEKMGKESYSQIHDSIASHLLNLDPNDPLRITEIMYHFMESENADHAFEYYISPITKDEEIGATKVITEAIAAGEKGIEWALSILNETNTKKVWTLAPRYIYKLNNALAVEGNFNSRIKILEALEASLTRIGGDYKTDATPGYDFANLHGKLGEIYHSLGDFDQALLILNKCNKLFNELNTIDPKNEDLSFGLAISYEKLGIIHQEQHNFSQALGCYIKYNSLIKNLFDSNPQNENYKFTLAISFEKLGEIYQPMGNLDHSLQHFNNFHLLSKEVYESNPQNDEQKNGLAISYEKLGTTHQLLGNFDQALDCFNNYNILSKELYENNPRDENIICTHAISYAKLGEIHQPLGNWDEAIESFNKYNEIFKKLHESNPQSEDIKTNLAISYEKIGHLNHDLGNFDQALYYLVLRRDLANEIFENNPKNKKVKYGLAISYQYIGTTHQARGDFDSALECFHHYRRIIHELHENNPMNYDLNYHLAISYGKMGEIHQSLGNLEEALSFYDKYNHLTKELSEKNPEIEDLKNGLAVSYEKVGTIYQACGDFNQALHYFKLRAGLGKELYDNNSQNIKNVFGFAISHFKLGEIYFALSQIDLSRESFEQALNIFNYLFNKTEIEQPKNEYRFWLGRSFYNLEKYGEAIEYLTASLNARIKLHGENSQEADVERKLLGDSYYYAGMYEEAIECYTATLELRKKLYGEGSEKVDLVRFDLGLSFYYLEKYSEAIEYLRASLEVRKKLYGEDSLELDSIWFWLGDSYYYAGMYKKAIDCYTASLAVRKKLYGEDSAEVDVARFSLGQTFSIAEMYPEAMNCFRESLTFRKSFYGRNSQEYQEAKEWLE